MCQSRVWKADILVQSNQFPWQKIAAGNLLLGFAILAAGTSTTKVFRVFQHIMGLACVSLTTFFKYQRSSKINTTCKFYSSLLTHGHFLYNKLIFFVWFKGHRVYYRVY